jgi:hypothetical protein
MSDADAIATLRTIMAHITYVRSGLERVAADLRHRALVHDLSKLSADEFDGFTRINRAAREHPYGSEEYRAGLRTEKPTIDLHYSRNSHHPEHGRAKGEAAERERGLPDDATYWSAHSDMTFLDVIEMVCDWRGAYLGYGSQGTWEENIARQHERYGALFAQGQWWLIDQVAAWIAPPPTPAPEGEPGAAP